MLKINNIEVHNFEAAFRGMRNPLNSWDKSDSKFGKYKDTETYIKDIDAVAESFFKKSQETNDFSVPNYMILDWLEDNNKSIDKEEYCPFHEYVFLGANDLSLAQRLIAAGGEHSKFMRQIEVSMDITAPLYWWKEYDTYKVATTANSTSTMHTITKQPFVASQFSFDGEKPYGFPPDLWIGDMVTVIDLCEKYRKLYLETKDKRFWRRLIQMLPESYNQTRTVTLNYAVLQNIVKQRENHKLREWHQFIDEIKQLPYAEDLITYKKGEDDDYGLIHSKRKYE